jgi:hypothetical protein
VLWLVKNSSVTFNDDIIQNATFAFKYQTGVVKMKIRNSVKCLPLIALLFTSFAYADVELKDNSEILGHWTVTAEALKIDGDKKFIKSVWEFKNDGTLVSVSTDSLGRTKEMTVVVKYSVEDGVIKKQLSPGREKYESCPVVQKEGSDMVLKCTNLFLFLTKK